MADNFNRQVLRVAVAQICQSMGWDALQKSTHDTLTDVMQRYLEEIGKVAYSYTQLCEFYFIRLSRQLAESVSCNRAFYNLNNTTIQLAYSQH